MVRVSRWLIPTVVALALVLSASSAQAQVVCYQPPAVAVAPVTSYYYTPAPVFTSYYAAPAPVVASYYAPAPVVSYYAPAPVVTSYYAPAAAVTTYRYGPLGRLRGVRSYYAPSVVGYYYP
jgi:hypothetical protein